MEGELNGRAGRVAVAARDLHAAAAAPVSGDELAAVLSTLADACAALDRAADRLADSPLEVSGLRRGTPADDAARRRVEDAVRDVAARLRAAQHACHEARERCETELADRW